MPAHHAETEVLLTRESGPARCESRQSRERLRSTCASSIAAGSSPKARIASSTGDSVRIFQRQQRGSNRPATARLPMKGNAEANAFFFRKRDHLDRQRQEGLPAPGEPIRAPAPRPARRRTRPRRERYRYASRGQGGAACEFSGFHTPRRLPTASTRTSIPSATIRRRRCACTSCTGGVRNRRVIRPGSSVMLARCWHSAMACRARSLMSEPTPIRAACPQSNPLLRTARSGCRPARRAARFPAPARAPGLPDRARACGESASWSSLMVHSASGSKTTISASAPGLNAAFLTGEASEPRREAPTSTGPDARGPPLSQCRGAPWRST